MAIARRRTRDFTLKAICAGVAACFPAAPSWANPTGAQVVAGQAAFSAQGPLLTVTNAPGTVINWQSFSIGAGETTRFVQQSAQSAVLNRVVAPDPSVILGNLFSNGRVFLVNPAGILVGAGARIDVAGFVASTLNLSNEDFAAGRLRFQPVPNAGTVVNEGAITTPEGGQVYLVAPTVTNSGTIVAPRGEAILAAGNQVELLDTATPGVRVQIEVPGGEARNLGRIVSDSGRIGIVGALVSNSGQLSADQVVGDGHGRIFLKAAKSATLDAGSTTSASGADGGTVDVESGVDGDADATTTVSGAIDVSGSAGKGGTAMLLAPHVALAGDATIRASGTAGGGTVLIGGDYQGSNAAIANARTTSVAATARVDANATAAGDGGKVIVWSDDATGMYGRINARGGAQSGNGGFVEVSSHHHVDFTGLVDTSAARGAAGMLLLDPDDVEIVDDGFDTSATQIRTSTIGSQLALGNFTITTNSGSNSGNIKVNHALQLNSANNLTMLAANNLDVTEPVSNSGSGSVKLMAGWTSSSGTSSPTATAGTGTLTVSNGGSITLGSGALTLVAGQGMTISGGTNVLKTSGGAINLQVSGSSGINLSPSSTASSIDAGSGLITLTGGSGGVTASTTSTTMTLASTNATLGVSADKLILSSGTVSVNGIASLTSLTVRGGSAAFNSDATIGTLSLTSGTLNGASTNGVTTSSSLTWSGGTVLGRLTLGSDASGTLSGSSRTLGSSTVASRFTNKGTITDNSSEAVSNSSKLTLSSTSSASTVLDNQGTYKTGTSYGYSILDGGQGGSVTNSGTFDVGSASYTVATGLSMSNSGTVNVGGGSLTTGAFTSSGVVKLAGSSATDALAVNGNLNLTSASTIRSSIAGTGTSAYGHIGVTGTADLQGTFQFVNSDYSPQVNDTFTIVSYGSKTANQFSKVQADFQSTFAATYDTTSTTAKITSLTGGLNSWLSAGDGAWTTIDNWSFGHIPTSTEDALIDSAVGTATISSGSQAVHSLTSDAGVTVSGGTLDFASASKINAMLTVSGGTVQGAGNLTVKNLTLSAGTVGGTGTLTVSDSYSRSGGTVSSTLTGLTVTQASGNLVPGSLSIAGPVSLTASSGALSLDSISATTIFGKASGGVTINSGAALTASGTGNALTLVDGTSFVNNAGASALSASNGRWLVYSQDPSQDTRGGLAYGFKQYARSYDGSAYSGSGSGNGFVYSVSPTLTASLTGTVGKTYDGTTTATLSSSNLAISGLIDGDSASYTTSSVAYADKNAGSGKTVTASVALSGASNGSASVYGYQLSSGSLSGAVGKIDPATLFATGFAVANKVYDGTTNAAVSGGTLSGVLSGDTVTVSATGAFADANVGTAKAVTLASIALGGADAANYSVTKPSPALAADITVRPLATWTGGASGLWSDSANWDQGVVPVGANVLAASLPGVVKVTYDASAGSTTLKSLDSTQALVLKGGALTLGTAATDVSTFASGATLELQAGSALSAVGMLKAASYLQSGGTLSGTGSLVVNGAFAQTAGTIALTGSGAATITQATGNLALGALTAPSVVLKAQSGAISQGDALVVPVLDAQATGGISLGNAGNRVSTLSASNSGSGNVAVVNGVPLTITGITNAGGDIAIDNTGAVTTTGAISAPAGAVSVLAHSPLSIGSGGVAAGGAITLSAGQTAGSGDDLTLSGKVASSGSGSAIALSAGDDLLQNAAVTSNGGNVTASADGGSISMGLGASTSTGGGNATYAAPGGDIVLTRIDAGTGAVGLTAGGNTRSASGYSGANVIAAKATITAGGNATFTAQVESLESHVSGTYNVTDATTGLLVVAGRPAANAAIEGTEQAVVSVVNTTTADTSRASSAATSTSSSTTSSASTAASGSTTAASAITSGTTVATANTGTLPTKTDPDGTIGGGANEFGGTSSSSSSSSSSGEQRTDKGNDQKATTQASNKQGGSKDAGKKLAMCR